MTDAARAHLRVARATADLEAVVAFYRDGLGFDVLARFDDHDGFDGVMLGRDGVPWHLEFTRRRGHPVPRVDDGEDLLVFYLPDGDAWRAAVRRLEARGHRPVPSTNPWWDRQGRTYEDPDGRRVVLQQAAWPG
jgi:catechol 2,3-dioxygenase-like lactoylglutathione lyase family enzyme